MASEGKDNGLTNGSENGSSAKQQAEVSLN